MAFYPKTCQNFTHVDGEGRLEKDVGAAKHQDPVPATPPPVAAPAFLSLEPTSPKKLTTFKSTLLDVNTQKKVVISYVKEGPEKIYVHLVEDAKILQNMMYDINQRTYSRLAEPPMIGTICLSRFPGDQLICRAIVIDVSGDRCKLFFVDFGDTEMVSYYDIFDIPEEFIKPNVFARRFCLSGVHKLEKGPHLNKAFKQLVKSKVLWLKVVSPEGPPLFQFGELFLDDKNILDLLIANNLQFKCLGMLPKGVKHSILVSYVDSCLNFYVQLSHTIDDLNSVMAAVKVHCENSCSPGELPVGASCCARFPDNGKWYRARVSNVKGKKVTVAYVDYGNEQEIDVSELRTITPDLIRLPAVAMKCALKGFENKPVETKSSNQLKMLALEKTLIATVMGVTSDTMLVTLVDDTASPPLDVARRMNQLSQPTSSQEIAATKPVRKVVRFRLEDSVPEDAHKRSFRREESVKDSGRPPRDSNDFPQRGGSDNRFNQDVSGEKSNGPGKSNERTGASGSREGRPDQSDNRWKRRDNKDRSDFGNRDRSDFGNRDRSDFGNRDRSESVNRDRSDVGNRDRSNFGNRDRSEFVNRDRSDFGNRDRSEFVNRDRSYFGNRDRSEFVNRDRSDFGNRDRSEFVNRDRRNFGNRDRSEFVNRDRSDFGNRDRNEFGNRDRSDFGNRDRSDFGNRDRSDFGNRDGKDFGNTSRKNKFTQGQYKEIEDPVPLETPFEDSSIKLGAQHEVSVTWFLSPESFYIQIVSSQRKFSEMMHKIPVLYKGVKPYTGNVPVGASVLARYPVDRVLYRATVIAVRPKLIVRFVDFGNMHLVEARDIWQLDRRLMELPKMAVHCSLVGVAPKDGEWKTVNAIDRCFNSPRLQCVFQGVAEDQYKVSLWNDGVSVADTLVEKQLAIIELSLIDEPIDMTIIVGQQILCRVTHVESYELFYIQLDIEKAALVEKIIDNCNLAKLTPLAPELLVEGTYCIVKHDGKLYRAVLQDTSDKANIKALLVDYGNEVTTFARNITLMPTEVRVYSYQAVPCCLHNYSAESDSLMSRDQLINKLTGNKLIVYVDHVDGIKLVTTLYDATSGQKIAIFSPDEGAYDEVVPLCMRAVFNYNFGMAYISHVENLNELYLQKCTDGDRLAQLLDELYECYEEGSPEALTDFEVDAICAARSTDGNWYRCTVVAVEDQRVKVRFTDYGNCETVDRDVLKRLEEKLFEPCALAAVAGLDLVSLRDDAVPALREWTSEEAVRATLRPGAGGWTASLWLPGAGVDLSACLVDAGLAAHRPGEGLEGEGLERRLRGAGDEDAAIANVSCDSRVELHARAARAGAVVRVRAPACGRAPALEICVRGRLAAQLARLYGEHTLGNACRVRSLREFYVRLLHSLSGADGVMSALTAAELGAGSVSAARRSEDEQRYRPKVLEICDTGHRVQFIDHGNKAQCDEFRRPRAALAAVDPPHRGALHDLLNQLAAKNDAFQIDYLDSTKEPTFVKVLINSASLVSMLPADVPVYTQVLPKEVSIITHVVDTLDKSTEEFVSSVPITEEDSSKFNDEKINKSIEKTVSETVYQRNKNVESEDIELHAVVIEKYVNTTDNDEQFDEAEEDLGTDAINTSQPNIDENKSFEAQAANSSDELKFVILEDAVRTETPTSPVVDTSSDTFESSAETIKTPEKVDSRDLLNTGCTNCGDNDKSSNKNIDSPKKDNSSRTSSPKSPRQSPKNKSPESPKVELSPLKESSESPKVELSAEKKAADVDKTEKSPEKIKYESNGVESEKVLEKQSDSNAITEVAACSKVLEKQSDSNAITDAAACLKVLEKQSDSNAITEVAACSKEEKGDLM